MNETASIIFIITIVKKEIDIILSIYLPLYQIFDTNSKVNIQIEHYETN